MGSRGSAQVYAYVEADGGSGAIGSLTDLFVSEVQQTEAPDQEGPQVVVQPPAGADLQAVPVDALWEATLTTRAGSISPSSSRAAPSFCGSKREPVLSTLRILRRAFRFRPVLRSVNYFRLPSDLAPGFAVSHDPGSIGQP